MAHSYYYLAAYLAVAVITNAILWSGSKDWQFNPSRVLHALMWPVLVFDVAGLLVNHLWNKFKR